MRVGLIGAGRIGAFHGRTLAAHADVGEVIVTDPLPERAQAVADDVAGKVAPDAESMIGSEMTSDLFAIARINRCIATSPGCL